MPIKTKIADIMTKDAFYVEIEDTIHHADEIMKNEKIKQVPVVENGIYAGLITERTLREYSLRELYEFDDAYGEQGYNKITDFQNIIHRQDHVVYPEDSVAKAIKLMAKYHLDCLPVVDWNKKLVGIVSSSDLMLFIHRLIEDDMIK